MEKQELIRFLRLAVLQTDLFLAPSDTDCANSSGIFPRRIIEEVEATNEHPPTTHFVRKQSS